MDKTEVRDILTNYSEGDFIGNGCEGSVYRIKGKNAVLKIFEGYGNKDCGLLKKYCEEQNELVKSGDSVPKIYVFGSFNFEANRLQNLNENLKGKVVSSNFIGKDNESKLNDAKKPYIIMEEIKGRQLYYDADSIEYKDSSFIKKLINQGENVDKDRMYFDKGIRSELHKKLIADFIDVNEMLLDDSFNEKLFKFFQDLVYVYNNCLYSVPDIINCNVMLDENVNIRRIDDQILHIVNKKYDTTKIFFCVKDLIEENLLLDEHLQSSGLLQYKYFEFLKPLKNKNYKLYNELILKLIGILKRLEITITDKEYKKVVERLTDSLNKTTTTKIAKEIETMVR